MAIFIPLVTKFDDSGLQGAQRALANFNNFAVEVGRAAAAAIGAVGVASVREAAQFETSIAKVECLVGITGKELDDMAAAARRMGIETGKGGQEAADALFVIASSGLRGSDAMEALELSLKASTAGLGETEAIARSVSGALSAYGTDVISAAQATDVIVATARAGNFETSQFAAAIGRVLPFAKQAGSSLEDMGGAVALLTRTNTDAAQSVTQISALFRAFVVPTEEAKKALENVGLSAQDMRDAIAKQGLPAALDMLDEKLGGNREQLGRLLGSSEAASAAFQILDADSKTIAETFGVVNNAAGITEEAFLVMQDTAENKFAVAMATAKDSLINIGSELLDRLLPYLDQFKVFMEENGPQIEQVFDTIFGAVEAVAGKLGELADAVMPAVMDLINNEQFQENIKKLGENFFLIADQVIRFIDSDLGQFLLDLTGKTITGGLEILNDQLERLANLMFVVNESMDVFAGKKPSVDFETLIGRAGAAINIRLGELAQYFLDMQASTTINPSRRAGGGPVSSGNSFLVGEMGPELFTPSAGGGRITPNDALGGNTYNITVNAGMGTNGAALGAQIVSAIKKFERTSGPVFASA
jgi:TP901 family phage tail tape measure protein